MLHYVQVYNREITTHSGVIADNLHCGPDNQDTLNEKRSILEPAGALSSAGAEVYCKYYSLRGESIVAVTNGANMNFDKVN